MVVIQNIVSFCCRMFPAVLLCLIGHSYTGHFSFYVTYIVFSIPGTLLAKAILPSTSIAIGCLIWSVGACGMAGSHSYGSIIVCRLFIGLGEALFGQAVALHYSLWLVALISMLGSKPFSCSWIEGTRRTRSQNGLLFSLVPVSLQVYPSFPRRVVRMLIVFVRRFR